MAEELKDYMDDLSDDGPDTPVDVKDPRYALALLTHYASVPGNEQYAFALGETVFDAVRTVEVEESTTFDDVLTQAVFRAPREQCSASYAVFPDGGGLADVYLCADVQGHLGLHMDRERRKAWPSTPAELFPEASVKEQVRRLAKELEGLGARYTRSFGKESNAERVLELTLGDAYQIALRIQKVLEGAEDPGDERYLCSVGTCRKHKGHGGGHDSEAS